MNCIVIEDDYLSQQAIVRNCQMYGVEIKILGIFETVEEAEKFIKDCTIKIDLIFLDIVLPGKNGMEFIADLLIVPYIIMTTAYDSYAVKAFELNVIDYLKKPFIYRRFAQSIQKVKKLIKLDEDNGSNEMLILKNKGTILRFQLNEIDYIESYSDYIKIFIKNESFLHLIALKKIKQRLSSDRFIQIHRRFIINSNKVSAISNNKVSIQGYGALELPISRAQRKEFYEHFLEGEILN